MFSLAMQKVEIPQLGRKFGTGWIPPFADGRDYVAEDKRVTGITDRLGKITPSAIIPSQINLSPWCSPVEDQGSIASCTAHAASSIIEYFENRTKKKVTHVSRLFVYKTTRNLMCITGDTGAFCRTTMGALVHCGWLPERYWPYIEADIDKEPTAFHYAYADNYESLKYFCHDPLGNNIEPSTVLQSVKTSLSRGVPSMFGFYGYPSFFLDSDVSGDIPFPNLEQEQALWCHAVAAVGYDDYKTILNTEYGIETEGALLIRNSWGTSWGNNGYAWLPYQYVLDRLAIDFWSILAMEWVDTEQFQE
ncbi:C1 family peptidase [Chloroflexota bacterium]